MPKGDIHKRIIIVRSFIKHVNHQRYRRSAVKQIKQHVSKLPKRFSGKTLTQNALSRILVRQMRKITKSYEELEHALNSSQFYLWQTLAERVVTLVCFKL